MFEMEARSICIGSENLTGTNAAATGSRVHPRLECHWSVFLTRSDHAWALFSARPSIYGSGSEAWVPNERFRDVPIPVHLFETIQETSGCRFFAVRKTESEEQPQETEEQQLEAEPLDATGAAVAAAEPPPPPLEPEPLSPKEDRRLLKAQDVAELKALRDDLHGSAHDRLRHNRRVLGHPTIA